jgi:hypothetical protein
MRQDYSGGRIQNSEFRIQEPGGRSGGVLEYWSIGVLEYWSIGVLEYWSIGVLEYWSGGVVEWWRSAVREIRMRGR